MKKIALVLIALIVLLPAASFANLEEKTIQSGFVLLDLPLISAVHHDKDTKEIVSFTGVNSTLGITHRQFFEPVKPDAWNVHWDIGTILLIIPYAGIGADYIWSNGWYVGGGLFYIVPEVHAGYYF